MLLPIAVALLACAGPVPVDASSAPMPPRASAPPAPIADASASSSAAPSASIAPPPVAAEPANLRAIDPPSGAACEVRGTHWQTRELASVAVNEGDVMGGYPTYEPLELRVAPNGPAFAYAYSGWDPKLSILSSSAAILELGAADRTEAIARRGVLTVRGFVASEAGVVLARVPMAIGGYVAPTAIARMRVVSATPGRVVIASPARAVSDVSGATPTAEVSCDALALERAERFDALAVGFPKGVNQHTLPIACLAPKKTIPIALEATGKAVARVAPTERPLGAYVAERRGPRVRFIATNDDAYVFGWTDARLVDCGGEHAEWSSRPTGHRSPTSYRLDGKEHVKCASPVRVVVQVPGANGVDSYVVGSLAAGPIAIESRDEVFAYLSQWTVGPQLELARGVRLAIPARDLAACAPIGERAR